MVNIGILLRGKSLDKLPIVCNEFDDCFIVNDWKRELGMFGKHIIDKHIIQCSNSMADAMLTPKQYKQYNISKVVFSFTQSMLDENKKNKDIPNRYKKFGVSNVKLMDEKYRDRVKRFRNTGLACIFYVAEVLKPKIIWAVGLEFYTSDYLVKKNSSHHERKAQEIRMKESFIQIVKNHPNTQFNIGTYYKGLPNLNNLKIL